ncbi:Abi-alpha family protein [Paraflavitalea sp. CAU 1676]|uniref:Abi-alpha family protein n=1 Tax=Paraflavitalea sp. CAU 1676 TaxID=3032598 RepID=UPI0023DB5025|nr:Abi-alpha family protein [Paraflavitalea sp. CAU 1676]MDF2192079.1 Abi-alpha family protein [Paraflavitalea sp. CAU 1676]
MSNQKATDLLGVQPIAEAVDTAVTFSTEAAKGFLKRVCAPALEEIGLMLKDQVRSWRLNNILRILQKAKGKIDFENEQLHIKAHPRVALSIIDNGSLNDSDEIQELWAGLLASSCTKDGQDDENLIFSDLLKQLTVIEARILKYSCEKASKVVYPNGLLFANSLNVTCEDLFKICVIDDIFRIDRELDHLRTIGLIGGPISGGFDFGDHFLNNADITPTALALNLYVKSQGHNGNPAKFWNI